MKQRLKSYLAKPLGVVGAFPTKMTQRDEIQALVKRLYPRSGGKALIRLGSKNDGGYLVPDDLLGIEACFSPGVNAESGFEKDCAEFGMNVFLADKSVEGPALEHHLFSFEKKFVGAVSNDDFMTLDDWVTASIPKESSDLLLQMDIEGHEYAVLLATSESLMKRFRIIVAEFHHLDCFWSEPFFRVAQSTFDKILQTHTCIHIHPNNFSGSIQKGGLNIPRLMEFTFLRNDRVEDFSDQVNFPNPLDSDNDATMATLVLPKCWYGHE
jgi:hypothetical protein